MTNDHFDEDGLASLFTLVEPERALALGDRLVAFAAAGDFDVAPDPGVASSVLAARALLDPERGRILSSTELAGTLATALRYEALLPRLPELLEHPEHFAALYAEEEALLTASRRALAEGRVSIEEHPELDLAVVTLPDGVALGHFAVGHRGGIPLHPLALHSATRRSRVLVACGSRFTYHDRYESWVTVVSRPVARRRELAPLALRLSEEEGRGARWTADAAGALVAVLDHEGESALTLERVLALLTEHLRRAPVAWDPFAPGGRGPGGRPASGRAASRGGTSGRGRPRGRGRSPAPPSA